MSEDTNATNDVVAYRNQNTGTIHLFDGPNPDLEARANFVRVELSEVPAVTLHEARVARASAESVARAGEARHRRVGVELTADPGEVTGTTAATPVTKRTGAGDPTGVLSRPGVDDVQIGPDPEKHPRTDAELAAQVELDAEQPANVGVLVKQHLDGDEASEQVPSAAKETAERVAEGTDVSEVKVAEDVEDKPAASPRKATAKKATATKADDKAGASS